MLCGFYHGLFPLFGMFLQADVKARFVKTFIVS